MAFDHEMMMLLVLMYEKIHEKCLFFEQIAEGMRELPEKWAMQPV
ncbi:hypothetical protein [Comamonas testosteroni]